MDLDLEKHNLSMTTLQRAASHGKVGDLWLGFKHVPLQATDGSRTLDSAWILVGTCTSENMVCRGPVTTLVTEPQEPGHPHPVKVSQSQDNHRSIYKNQ